MPRCQCRTRTYLQHQRLRQAILPSISCAQKRMHIFDGLQGHLGWLHLSAGVGALLADTIASCAVWLLVSRITLSTKQEWQPAIRMPSTAACNMDAVWTPSTPVTDPDHHGSQVGAVQCCGLHAAILCAVAVEASWATLWPAAFWVSPVAD